MGALNHSSSGTHNESKQISGLFEQYYVKLWTWNVHFREANVFQIKCNTNNFKVKNLNLGN